MFTLDSNEAVEGFWSGLTLKVAGISNACFCFEGTIRSVNLNKST